MRETAVKCSGVLFASGRLHSYMHRGRSRTGRLAPGYTKADSPPPPHDAAPHGAAPAPAARVFPMPAWTFACISRSPLAPVRLFVTGRRDNSENRAKDVVKPCQLFPPCLRLSFAHGRVRPGVLKRRGLATIAGQSIGERPQERGLGADELRIRRFLTRRCATTSFFAEAGGRPTSTRTAAMLHARSKTWPGGGECAVSSDSHRPLSPTYQASANAGASQIYPIPAAVGHKGVCHFPKQRTRQSSASGRLSRRAVAVSRQGTQIDRTRSPGIGCRSCEPALLRRCLRHAKKNRNGRSRREIGGGRTERDT
jgi:hypothetical protein